MTDKLEKEFRFSGQKAAEFLRDIADSIEDGQLALDGEDWKVSQPFQDKIPLRLYRDENGLEIGFKLLTPEEKE